MPPEYFPPIIPDEYKVVINVSGLKYEMDKRLLNKYPKTLLGNRRKRRRYYDKARNEYFLDRHRGTFEAIESFYTKGDGVLERPEVVPMDIFLHELRYYQFEYETIKDLLKREELLQEEKSKIMPDTEAKRLLWRILEEHDSSWEARIITLFSAFVIVVSVIVFCLETLETFIPLCEMVVHNDLAFEKGVHACFYENYSTSENETQMSSFMNNVDGELYHIGNSEADRKESWYPIMEECSRNQTISLVDRFAVTRCQLKLQHKRYKWKQLENILNGSSCVLGVNDSMVEDVYAELDSFACTVSYLCAYVENDTTFAPIFWSLIEADMGSKAGILFMVETACIVFFVFEIGLRFYSTPYRRQFFKVNIRF